MSDTQDNNKSKFSFDPSTAKPVDSPSVVKPDSFTFDPSTAKEDKKGIKGHAQDVGASLMGGLAAVPDTLVGLADMYTEGRAGKAIDDNLGDFYKLGDAQKYWQDQKTDVAKQQQQQFHDAEGIVDKTKIALQNPSMIANAAVESLPSMFLGGVLGKATKIASPIAAAAVGEGAVMAGAQAEQIRQNSDDQMLNNGQEAASALTGGLGALFGFAGGRIAQKLGIGDIDSMIVSGRIGPTQIAGEIANTSSKSLPRRVIEGAISEGFLEELPQSISEQIIQNLATDKHWSDGVDDAAVMGTLAGMAMGGVANIPSGHTNAQSDNNNIQSESTPISPLPQLGGPSMEGEYIPRGASEQNTANVNQTNYEYTQFDSDASNRLGNNGFGSTDTGNGPTDPVQPDIGGGSYFDSQKPSERLGLNPDNGPMSSAAALAVDSGASASATSMGDTASATSSTEQENAGTNFSDGTAQAIQFGMGEIAQGAKEAALENTIQRLEKDGEVQLFKEDSIAKALEVQNYNVRLNNDGSASIIGVKNPATNQWHGLERIDSSTTSTPALNMADNQDQSSDSNKSQELATLQQRFDEAKTVPEKAKIRKEINQLQNNQLRPGVNSNDKLQSTDEPEIRNSEVPDSTGNQLTSTSNSPTNDVENVPNEKGSKPSTVTNDVTDQINQLEQKFSSEKSVIQKNKIRKQINNLKSEFNNVPLDHGVLNVPLSKRGNIDKQIDQYKVEQSKLEKEKNDIKKMNHLDDQKIAKPAFESLTKDDFQNYANRAGIKLSEAKSELKSMAHWQPKKAVKVFDALKNSNNRDKREKIYTPSNREIEVRNKLIEADQLITSNHGNGAINENYPQILQPRDRTRPSSQAQVNEIANNLNPKLLGNSPSTANGSPIISNDNIIESGNGRVMAIRKAYEQGKAESYKKWLSEQGYDISKMKNPVLVRERLTELSDQDRIAYTKESNERTTLDLSPTERAIADADKVLNIIEDYLGGDLNSSNNRQFVNKFVTGVVTTNERASVIGNDKALTQQGKRRIQAALVAAAYGDSSIIDQVFEDSDSEIKSIGNALTDAAGSWALMRKLAQQGSIPSDLDVTSNLIEAVHLVQKARNEKRKLIELVAQDDIFEGELDQTTKDFLSIFYRGEKYLQARSREKVADALNYYANQAQKVQPGENLFGDLPKSESDLIRETYERQQNQETDKQQDIFSSSKSNDTNIRKIGTTGQRTTTESKNEKTSKQSEVSGKKPIEDKLEQINLQANELVENNTKDYSRKTPLKPDEDRKGISPIETTFNALSVVSASRRVLSVLQHLKLSATQDPILAGRISIGSISAKGGFNVQVISSFDRLPKEIQKDATYKDDKGNTQNYDVSAVWHDGTLYVVADQVYGDSKKQLTTFDAYEEMLAHEIIGHFGIQQIFGHEYKTKLQQLYNALGKMDGIRKIAADNGVDMVQFEKAYIEPYTQGAKDGIYAESDVQQALVGELFAFISQNKSKQPFVRQKLKEVLGYIRQWFRERGFDKFLSRYNDADLMMFLSEARKAVVDRSYFGKYKNQNISAKNDSDTPLYSRSRENKAGSTVKQVRDVLIERFGKDTINELERQGKLEIIQDYSVDGVEGFYYNGKAVLVASNLTNESAIPTFLHELGGHAGFQNMMNQEQYNELMRQFDKLVEQGNPVAMAAKLLAEREQGNVRQQLEYLPYLLTLSSTMQQRNVIQRNALNKLIQNIVTYVKAWVFDNFGINLNLNPDDILALSERMVKQIERQSSLDTVRQKYHGTSQWMTAPNGAKTHLSEQQWLQVRTPEFKKWFGDWENDAKNASQVLDENGEPKVVYHGTATEFNEFRKGHGLLGDGIYLTDSFDTADMYANNRGKNGFVLPLFVNIRNALKTTGNVSRDKVVEATNSGKYQGIVHQFEDQELIVALESNQVKIAEGNTGTFNSESADIRFSKSAKEIIDRLSKKMGDLSVKSVKEKTGYKFTDWLSLGLSTLGRRQLTEIYSKILPQLNKYNDLAAQMDADKNDAGAEADSIVRDWANLKDENQLADLMHDATLAKIDPAKPYVKGDSIIKYKQLRDDFNALTPEAQAMYIKARDAYKKHYAKVQFAIKERILKAALSSQKKADLIKQMDDQFYGYVKGVYFPLSRFGKYVVVTRNNLGQVESVSRAETMAEAQALRSELMQKYPHFKVDRVILDKEFSASRDAAGRGFMSNLFDEVANLGLSASEMVEFEDTLNQLYLSSMPDLSWAKHGIHRKGTAGFSQDARRAFAQNMFHGAGYLAKLRYGDQMAEQLDAMQKYSTEQTKANSNYDQPVAQRVIDEMNKRHELLMNPKSHPLSSALTSFGFIYYLGLSPAAAIVNLSQTALVAYPIMGAKWGFDKAATELLKASNDFRKGVDFHKVKWEGTKTDLYKTVSSDISKFLNKDEKQAYDDAVARGVIDVTQAHDLAGIAQGEDSGIMWKTRPIMRAASVMFHSAERFNREVTFIAAYRLARQSGSKHDLAFDQAVDATYKGHFDYSSGNRPRIMQGNVAKVLLLFKQFGQNMIYTLVRQTYQSIKGETDAERKEARKSLGAILAMHATFAGVLGLPMVGMLLSLASWAGGDDDDPWDAEVALRNYLAEAFGPTISNLLMKGAPRALTPADVSSRVGINNLLLPDVQEGLEGKRWAESAMAGALGPVAGIGLNVAKGAQEISEGHNLRGMETMLPVFLKNFAKTYRYGDEGVQDKTGVSIMDEVSSMDLLVQGMGFSPSDVRTANEGKSAIYQLDKKLNERRGRLMALWSRAKMMDDQQEMDEIWKEIQGFNHKNPSRSITRVNLNQSYKNRQRRIDRSEDGIYLSKNRQEARSAGYFAFSE